MKFGDYVNELKTAHAREEERKQETEKRKKKSEDDKEKRQKEREDREEKRDKQVEKNKEDNERDREEREDERESDQKEREDDRERDKRDKDKEREQRRKELEDEQEKKKKEAEKKKGLSDVKTPIIKTAENAGYEWKPEGRMNLLEKIDKMLIGEEEQTAYQKYFEKKMKEWDIDSPEDLDDAEKKKFFDEVDKGWKAKDEKNESRSISEETEYAKYFMGKLKKWKVNSPAELDDEEKKKFFDEVSKDWKG